MKQVNRYLKFCYCITFCTLAIVLSACGPRVLVSTGTTIGMKATPGDAKTQPPQVTLGYKRAELALIPTAGKRATETRDAFSTLAAVHFYTDWFGKTELQSVIGTGVAARCIVKNESFQNAMLNKTNTSSSNQNNSKACEQKP